MQFEILGGIAKIEPIAIGSRMNDGYAVSLEKRKIYVSIRDLAADRHGLIRVVDESGDDYLYPKDLFRAIDLPQSLRKAVLAAA